MLDAIEKSLNLSQDKMEPSRHVLHYGNVSSASIWYEMEYILNAAIYIVNRPCGRSHLEVGLCAIVRSGKY